VVIALVEDEADAKLIRKVLNSQEAEAVDAAREQWWISLRSAEQEHYLQSGRTLATTRSFTAWASKPPWTPECPAKSLTKYQRRWPQTWKTSSSTIRRRDLNAERERCWNKFHQWWNGKDQRWETEHNWENR
jgi:hypothetical protein